MHPSRLVLWCLAPLVLGASVGCLSNPWRQEVLSIDERIFLYKENKVVDGTSVPLGVTHPVQISARDVEAMLANLVYVRRSVFTDPAALPIFTPAQAQRYSGPISRALASLSATERLRFLVPDSSLSNIFVSSTGTTGVIFASNESSLDIAFDAIHEGVNDGDGGRPEEVWFAEDPTALTTARPIIPFAGSRRHVDRETRTDYPGWIVINRDALVALPILPPGRSATKRAPDGGVAAAVAGDSGDDGTPVASHAKEPGTPAPAAPPPTPEDDEAYRKLRRKIESLKRLHGDGAITDEEYTKRFEKLMQEL